jgi:hypothetical protein
MNALDAVFATDNELILYLIQGTDQDPLFELDALLIALARPGVREEILQHNDTAIWRWVFRIDNAGRLDTAFRMLGYILEWDFDNPAITPSKQYWIRIKSVRRPDGTA